MFQQDILLKQEVLLEQELQDPAGAPAPDPAGASDPAEVAKSRSGRSLCVAQREVGTFPEVPQHVCCQGDAEDEADQGYGGEGGSVVAQEQRQRMLRRRRSSSCFVLQRHLVDLATVDLRLRTFLFSHKCGQPLPNVLAQPLARDGEDRPRPYSTGSPHQSSEI